MRLSRHTVKMKLRLWFKLPRKSDAHVKVKLARLAPFRYKKI